MNIITKSPILLKNESTEGFLPFDADYFMDEAGEEFYSADGENFYNVKGKKSKGTLKKIGKGFSKVGKGLGKAAKFVGKGIVKAQRGVVKASKSVAKNVKKVGGKAKAGSKKLIHHKKRDNADKTDRGAKVDDTKGVDVFTKPLVEATSEQMKTMPADKVVEIEGKNYLADGIDKEKPVTVSVDPETGAKVVGVEYKPEEVVAVDGADGNVEYHTPENVSGMSKNMKIALIVTGAVLVLGVVLFVVKSKKNK